MGETKVCARCGQEKPLEAFHKGKEKNGRRQPCAACRMAANAARRPPAPTSKTCKRCQQSFPIESFPRYGKRQNISAYCRPCINARAVENTAIRGASRPFVCKRCGEPKPPDAFLTGKDGKPTRLCKTCHSAHSVVINAKKRAALPKSKICRDCKESKPRADFPHMGGKPAPRCKPCHRAWENAKRAQERENAPRRNRFFPARVDEATGILVKKCTKCMMVKPVNEFGMRDKIRPRKTTRRSGDQFLRPTCMECERQDALLRAHANPELTRKIAKVRAERIKNAPRVEKIDRMAIIRRDRCTCYLCGDVLSLATRYPAPKSIVLDHVVPLKRGGSHTADNLRVACSRCNNRKKQKLLAELGWYVPFAI